MIPRIQRMKLCQIEVDHAKGFWVLPSDITVIEGKRGCAVRRGKRRKEGNKDVILWLKTWG